VQDAVEAPPGVWFQLRISSEPAAGLSQSAAAPMVLALVTPQRSRLDSAEAGPLPYSLANPLALSSLSSPPGLGSILAGVSGPGTGSGLSAQLVPAGGNLPAQPGALSGANGIATDRLLSSGGSRQRVVLVGDLGQGRAARAQASRAASPLIRHSTLRPHSELPAPATDERSDPVPLPRAADLIAEALPFDRASLEDALEQFLRQLDHRNGGRFAARGPTPIVLFSLAVLGSVGSVEIARRFLRRRMLVAQGIRVGDPLSRGIPIGFPEMPGSWSENVR
jgi:hypothetical protein